MRPARVQVDSASKDGLSAKWEVGTIGNKVSFTVTEEGHTCGVVFEDADTIKYMIRVLKHAAKKAGIW